MSIEQLQVLVKWLERQIDYLESSIESAEETNNHGRKLQHQGMKEAFAKCLDQLNKQQARKKNMVKQSVTTNI